MYTALKSIGVWALISMKDDQTLGGKYFNLYLHCFASGVTLLPELMNLESRYLKQHKYEQQQSAPQSLDLHLQLTNHGRKRECLHTELLETFTPNY